MIAPASVTGSKVDDAAPSRRRLRSVGTLETVVVRCGEDSLPEADGDLFSAGQRLLKNSSTRRLYIGIPT